MEGSRDHICKTSAEKAFFVVLGLPVHICPDALQKHYLVKKGETWLFILSLIKAL